MPALLLEVTKKSVSSYSSDIRETPEGPYVEESVLFPFSGARNSNGQGFVFPFSSGECSDPWHCGSPYQQAGGANLSKINAPGAGIHCFVGKQKCRLRWLWLWRGVYIISIHSLCI